VDLYSLVFISFGPKHIVKLLKLIRNKCIRNIFRLIFPLFRVTDVWDSKLLP